MVSDAWCSPLSVVFGPDGPRKQYDGPTARVFQGERPSSGVMASGSRLGRRRTFLAGGATGIARIVSGGQTGADRAALDWALAHGIPHGGWCPKGRRAEDG